VYAGDPGRRSGASGNLNQNRTEVGDVAGELGAAGAEDIGCARREGSVCADVRSLNRHARSCAETGSASARGELRHFKQRGGAGALRELDGELEILRAVFVDGDEVEAPGRSLYGVGGDVEAADAGETRGVKRSLAGKREEENAVIIKPGFDHCATGVSDGRKAVAIADAVEVSADRAVERAIEEKIDDPERRAVGIADAVCATVVVGVALGDAVGNADAPCAGVERLQIADERRVGRDQISGGGARGLAVAAIVVLGEERDVALGGVLAEGNGPGGFAAGIGRAGRERRDGGRLGNNGGAELVPRGTLRRSLRRGLARAINVPRGTPAA